MHPHFSGAMMYQEP